MRGLPVAIGALALLLAACIQSPPPPSATPTPPPAYVVPSADLPPDYGVSQAAVADPSVWTQYLKATPAKYENHVYKTRNDTHLVHMEVLEFPDEAEARKAYEAYPAYLQTYAPCQNRRSLDLGVENFFCDNTGQITSEYLLSVSRRGPRLVAAHTHDPVTPGGDLLAFARKTLALLP